MLTLPNLVAVEVSQALQGGSIGIIPTEVRYSLAAKADNPVAVGRALKVLGSAAGSATVLLAEPEAVTKFGIPIDRLKVIRHYWPGSVDAIFSDNASDDFAYLQGGTARLIFRVPQLTPLRYLLERTGPLAVWESGLPSGSGEVVTELQVEQSQLYAGKIDFFVETPKPAGVTPTVLAVQADGSLVLRFQGDVPVVV
jgi:tRNA A37 threonylcarbamoyladenosine synthetase subunit TsaC/SUA5/YrdC